jgi:hypothetical protein
MPSTIKITQVAPATANDLGTNFVTTGTGDRVRPVNYNPTAGLNTFTFTLAFCMEWHLEHRDRRVLRERPEQHLQRRQPDLLGKYHSCTGRNSWLQCDAVDL